MQFNYYYSPDSTYKSHENHGTIHTNILLADSFMFGVDKSWADLLLEDINKWSSAKIYEKFKDVFKTDDRLYQVMEDYDLLHKGIKIINTVKHKTKPMIRQIAYHKSVVNNFKQELIFHRNVLLEHNKVTELMPFIDEDIWKLTLIDFENKTNQQDVLISEISNTLSKRENIFSFDKSIDKLFTFTLFDSMEIAACDFIKIPLWDFPFLESLKYLQLKYTRDDLKACIKPFHSQLKELMEEIFPISFVIENQLQLKQLIKSKLHPLIDSIQQSINESLYVSQTKNSLPKNTGLKFCAGIASAETMINYFKETQTVLPYVADEIKQQTGRHINLKASYVFTYFEVHIDENEN